MTQTTSDFALSIPIAYLESTIAEGMTISEYRVSRPPRPSFRQKFESHLRTETKNR